MRLNSFILQCMNQECSPESFSLKLRVNEHIEYTNCWDFLASSKFISNQDPLVSYFKQTDHFLVILSQKHE